MQARLRMKGEHYRFVKMVFTHQLIHFLSESLAIRFQVSAPPLGASTQFNRKRNFGRPSFIQGVRNELAGT
jgi:hypothetical protein